MIYISHGEKGGIGKSRLAMILADLLLKRAQARLAIVEGDKSGADVGARFTGLIETGFINLNRPDAMEEAFSTFGGWLEDHAQGADVVVNLPGQASDTLDQFAPLLAATAEAIGQDLTIFYSVGPLDIHSRNLMASIEEGLMAAAPIHRQIVVMSEIAGPVSAFHWHQSSERQQFLAAGGKEGVMPVLKPATLEQRIRDMTGSYSSMLTKESPLGITDRALLFRWLTAAHKVVGLGVPEQ